ncbi:MAG: ABC transporter permease subunit [Alphaproteobacteria bacterium]|nr:ABC transporter permease subunit [Alphaproteobacteria bacterium]
MFLPASAPARRTRRLPNQWDLAALLFVLGALAAFGHGAAGTLAPIDAPEATRLTLAAADLPYYALRTVMRMLAAMAASLLFTFAFATLAAKSRRAGAVLVPLLDILQSVPILGFLSFTIAFFMGLFPGQVLGLELAAIFAIFTSQAWNMAFAMYQSLTTLPQDLVEATRAYRLTAWQRFWRLEVPFAMPGLVWNMVLSMSGGWFFVVASEAITLGDATWRLPGIGSYVALALEQRDLGAIGLAVLAMGLVILAYDQLLFRPLVAWSGKFRFETTAGANAPDPWVLALLRRTRVLRRAAEALGTGLAAIGSLRLRLPALPLGLRFRLGLPRQGRSRIAMGRAGDLAFGLAVAALAGLAFWRLADYVAAAVSWGELGEVLLLALFTLLRVAAMIGLASIVWLPVGAWLGRRPALTRLAQPVIQFLAAFPANLLFPPFVVGIVHFGLSPEIWLSPLMVLGTQWYILFNVIAASAALPGDLAEAASTLRLSGWLWWRRVMWPAILPAYVTGAITASGGAWNAAIVAEVAAWGDTKLVASGLGAYIAQATEAGDFPRIALGVAVMVVFVVVINRLLWRPLAAFAARRATF